MGQEVHGCVLEQLIAEGGQGMVFRALQRQPERTVAVKAVRPGPAHPRRVRRFMEECALLAAHPHPNIVTLHDVGTALDADGQEIPFLIMEYLPDARSVTQAAGHFGWDRERRIEKFLDACRAVEHLHKRGVRHFDLKPQNILVDAEEWVRVSDLGLARSYNERIAGSPGGTLTHMSPEQCRGDPEALDHRSDVYSMGVVLYELLSGQLPLDPSRHAGEHLDVQGAFDLICTAPPEPLHRAAPRIDAELESIVIRALEKRPRDRYATMGEMIGALERYLAERRLARTRRLRRAVAWGTVWCLAMVLWAGATTRWGGSLLGKRTGFIDWYETTLVAGVEPVTPGADLLHAAVIAIGEETDAAALAAARGVEGVTDSVVSHRALHGELCRVLARSGARAVVFDIKFRSQTPYDAALAEGFRTLRDAGIGVVIAAPSWWVDPETGKPDVSATLWEVAETGCLEVELTAEDVLWIPLAVRTERGEVLASLSLAAYAASNGRGARHEFEMLEGRRAVEIERWRDSRGGWHRTGERDVVPVTWIRRHDPDPMKEGFGQADENLEAVYRPVMLELEPLEQATYRYEDVLSADEVLLRTWFARRTVFIGNFTRRARDLHPFRGREWAGVYFHVVSFESLARRVYPRAAGWGTLFVAVLGVAAVGFVAPGLGPRRGRLVRWLTPMAVLVALGALAMAAGLVAYSEWQVLLNPMALMVGGIGGLMIAAGRGAVRRRDWRC